MSDFRDIKLIASDIDGTLIQGEQTSISGKMIDYINTLARKNIRFVAASGRSYPNLREMFAPVKDNISYICDNGSLCIHNGISVYEQELEYEMCLKVMREARKFKDCSIFVSCGEGLYTDSYDQDFLGFMNNNYYYMIEHTDDLYSLKPPFYKIALFSRNSTDRAREYFSEFCEGRMLAKKTAEVWLEFISPRATKGDALKALGSLLGISPDTMMAFGDRYNDVEMLEYVTYSYAMENSEENLSDHTFGTTPTVEDTVGKLIKELQQEQSGT